MLGMDAAIGLMDFTGQGELQVLVSLGKVGFALVDVASGRILWQWASPAGAYMVRCQLLRGPEGVRLFAFPPSTMATVGLCFDFSGTDGTPRLLWEGDYTGHWWANYGPNLVLADMDGDGKEEVVVASKPAYVGVIDSDTGEIKFEIKYEITDPYDFGRPDGSDIGRPYGLLHAADVDGDGFPDALEVLTQVEEYISVLSNEDGKGLAPVWNLYVEKDFPEDHRELRAQPTSLVDVNGDGKLELVLGVYNVGEGERWRTIVLDTFGGFDARLADLEDRYFWGCFDINGDGRPEIITSSISSRSLTGSNTLEALDGQTFAPVAATDDAQPATTYSTIARMFGPKRPDMTYYGALVEPVHLAGDGEGAGLLVKLAAEQGGEYLWRVDSGEQVLEPFAPTALARAMIMASDEGEAAKVDKQTAAGGPASGGSVGASLPLVSEVDGRRELVMSMSDGTVMGGTPDLSTPGELLSSWRVRGSMPAIWLGPGGERIVCVAAPDRDVVTVLRPEAGRDDAPALYKFELPIPLNRNPMMDNVFPRSAGGMVPFGAEEMLLFVPLRTGEHQLGCALYSPSGEPLWTDREVGPHPRLAAVADLSGDGQPQLIVDNHGMQYHYDLAGKRRMVAHVWGSTIPERGDGCAHALPMVGPYGPDGAWRVVMTPGYTAMEVQDAKGERVAVKPFGNAYEFVSRATGIGNVRGGDLWDAGMVSELGVFHCVDLATCEDRWTLDLGVPTSWPIACATGDLDGDGRDEFLVGLPNGKLRALAEDGGAGKVLWEVTFDVGVRDAIIADLDGDGLAEIVVETEDGYVRVLKSQDG